MDTDILLIKKELDILEKPSPSGLLRNFVWGGGMLQQIQLRTEERENGDLGAEPP